MDIAFTRAISPRLPECELTHLEREPIDLGRAEAEHQAYEAALRDLGCEVRQVPPAPDHPDGVFVEDTVVVLEELAIVTRPGAVSRQGEVESVADAVGRFRRLVRVPAPATLDGGDVLVNGRTVFVGATARTNAAAHDWLKRTLGPVGYQVHVVPVVGCLHLKSAVTCPAPDTFLLNPEWVPGAAFAAGALIEVDPGEPHAANVLRVGENVLAAAGAPRTRRRLESAGLDVVLVEASELARAEAGVTCCSVVVPASGAERTL